MLCLPLPEWVFALFKRRSEILCCGLYRKTEVSTEPVKPTAKSQPMLKISSQFFKTWNQFEFHLKSCTIYSSHLNEFALRANYKFNWFSYQWVWCDVHTLVKELQRDCENFRVVFLLESIQLGATCVQLERNVKNLFQLRPVSHAMHLWKQNQLNWFNMKH